eukprot:CAMPEP_0201553064 /NCGR_PEP_ID=MMETSP0173_2-20130828/19418_1 /ASSEMBLY_ACC=CAM_ASM_000268 /TAXON_ID=218659 /ORGANISM="Vexillifera sp., Strain DIVA3 564/2" /LENGTH=423 /DNA_ID=CAMNT_0047963667 /DNA_START=163 /DNA_END=1434 /DNA_ORIENTATION=+
MKVATESNFSEAANVGIYINAGSAYENETNNGVAHFLEHLIFKGTNKRSQHDIELEVENMGAHLNAYTTREQTTYHARVFKQDVPKAVDILSDILQNSKLDEKAIEAEKGTILREKVEVEKLPEEVVFDHLHSAVFHGHGLSRTILGSADNIRNMKRQQLVDYIQTHYTADRMVLSAAGAVDHDQLVELANKAFASLPTTSSFKIGEQAPPQYFGSLVKAEEDDMPLAYLAYAAESVGWSHKDFFPLMVLQTLFGNWDRSMGTGKHTLSRTCEKIAKDDLAHSVMHFNTCYHNTGLFGAYAVAPEERLEDLSHALIDAWPATAHHVTASEVSRAKNKVRSNILVPLDTNNEIMEDIGRQMLTLGRRMSPAEVYARIDQVTPDDIQRVAKEYLVDTEISGAALGRVQTLPDYNFLRAWTSWYRL